MAWRTRIDAWEPGRRFVDSQLKGPYRSWYHEHSFRADGNATLMRDRVWYAPPLGPVGALANALVVAPQLRGIFGFRAKAIARRFGAAGGGRAPAPQPPEPRPAVHAR
jgi:ligand-binding SRPBCC domain-containing protein